MPYAIEAHLDPATETTVRAFWDALATEGIPSPATVPGRPHLSLARCTAADPARVGPALPDLARALPSCQVTFGSLGVFPPPEGILFLAPVVTRELLEFHGQIHRWLEQFGGADEDWYAPGLWVPHCSLTMTLSASQIPSAVEFCRRIPWPVAGQLVRLCLTRYPPVEELALARLGGCP